MNKLTLPEYALFDREVKKNQKKHPEWRYGQTLFNTLYDLFPEIAATIQETKFDPFYDDKKIEAFFGEILPK